MSNLLSALTAFFFCLQTEKDWDEVRNSAEGKRLDEAHHELVKTRKARFLENLKTIRLSMGAYFHLICILNI